MLLYPDNTALSQTLKKGIPQDEDNYIVHATGTRFISAVDRAAMNELLVPSSHIAMPPLSLVVVNLDNKNYPNRRDLFIKKGHRFAHIGCVPAAEQNIFKELRPLEAVEFTVCSYKKYSESSYVTFEFKF